VHSHSIVIDKFLREIVHGTLDAAPDAFGAACLAGFEFAADFMALAFRAYDSSQSRH
jgi:hypothetical protein